MKQLTLILLAAFLFVNCADDDLVNTPTPQGKGKIVFDVQVEEVEDSPRTRSEGDNLPQPRTIEMTGAASPVYLRSVTNNYFGRIKGASSVPSQGGALSTRGRLITTSDFFDDYGLIYFQYPPSKTWAADGSTMQPTVYNEQVRKAFSWQTAEYWPGSGRNLTFFAYAPYNATGLTLSPASQYGAPSFSYTVPDSVQLQSDLLVCGSENEVGNYNAVRPITFKHACAAIRFGIGAQMAACRIKRIMLKNVYSRGDYTLGKSTWDTIYTNSKKNFTLWSNYNITSSVQNCVLTTSDDVMMMLPQTLGDDAELVVTINDGEDHDLKAYITGDEWKMGHVTTYYLSTNVTAGGTVLSVSVSNVPIAATGGTAQYTVESYFATAYGTKSPRAWTAYYTLDDDTTKYYSLDPDALSQFTFSGGSAASETNNITANSQIPRSVSLNTYKLKHAAPQNKDLAIGNGGSANCYVVNAAGTYTFPCVYGNGLTSAGTARPASDYLADNFVNHAGTQINTLSDLPKIPESEVDNACIVWQDAKYLINPTSLQIVNRNGFKCVQFTIDTLNICQGNSIIAVRNSNYEILWSWHIWVTNQNINNTIRMENNNTGDYGTVVSNLASCPLGFCERDTFWYASRMVHLVIVQPSTNDTARVSLRQSSGNAYTNGVNATLYQWGRKDAQLPGNGNGNYDKKYYDNKYTYLTMQGSFFTTIANSITHPYQFFAVTGNDWCEQHYYNLWNLNFDKDTPVTINTTPVQKTVYDPCPAGFTLPRTAAFTGFNDTGNDQNISNPYYMTHPQYGVGSNFRTFSGGFPAGNPSNLFFPAMGWRDTASNRGSGTMVLVNQEGFYQTCGASSAVRGRNRGGFSAWIGEQGESCRSYAFPIWPVKE